tara:strand:- start:369 stop:863 length:495 start_codon:yes stop_codon:yes gene_type:complete
MLKQILIVTKVNIKIKLITLSIFFLTQVNALSNNNGIKIVSDQLNVEMNERISIFTGSVFANNKDMKMWSDEMTIQLKDEKDEIQSISAKGNIKLIRLDEKSEIYGDLAIYSLEDEIITVIGNVIIKENNNEISGSKLVVDMKNSSSIMVGSNASRVQALITDN